MDTEIYLTAFERLQQDVDAEEYHSAATIALLKKFASDLRPVKCRLWFQSQRCN